MNKFSLYCRDNALFVVAIGSSILLSLWAGIRETVINPDAICYLMSAQQVGESGIKDAMHLCGQAKWPFYSVLIYGLVQLSQFSYQTAAYFLNAIFSCLSVITFILIVKELGGSKRVLWLAAMVILLSHQFNSVREYIVRDHGFWAFYLFSIYCLLVYFKTLRWTAALGWSISLMVATLFRIEGAIFLLFLPLVSFFCSTYSWKQRFQSFLLLNVPLFLVCIGLIAWLIIHPQQTLDRLGRVGEVPHQIQHGLMLMLQRYDATKTAIAYHVLTHDSAKEAGLVLFVLLSGWYVVSIINNLSWIYAFLVIYAWFKKAAALTSTSFNVLMGYLSINFFITLGFLLENFFLSKRYLIAFSLVFMLWVPFALESLIQKRARISYRIALGIVGICIVLTSLGGLMEFGYSKSYIHEAGDWIADHVPINTALYSNDIQLMYYSRHFDNSIFEKALTFRDIKTIAHQQWKQYDYVALRLNKKEQSDMAAVLQEMNLQPVQVFSNERGDKVAIYKITP